MRNGRVLLSLYGDMDTGEHDNTRNGALDTPSEEFVQSLQVRAHNEAVLDYLERFFAQSPSPMLIESMIKAHPGLRCEYNGDGTPKTRIFHTYFLGPKKTRPMSGLVEDIRLMFPLEDLNACECCHQVHTLPIAQEEASTPASTSTRSARKRSTPTADVVDEIRSNSFGEPPTKKKKGKKGAATPTSSSPTPPTAKPSTPALPTCTPCSLSGSSTIPQITHSQCLRAGLHLDQRSSLVKMVKKNWEDRVGALESRMDTVWGPAAIKLVNSKTQHAKVLPNPIPSPHTPITDQVTSLLVRTSSSSSLSSANPSKAGSSKGAMWVRTLT